MSGTFITMEGGEGTGKSTQAQRLQNYLSGLGRRVVTTREPGGTPEAETIRQLLLSGAVSRWTAVEEALLNYAARGHHLDHLIRPALSRGDWVLCDRFMDSTRAYQGYAGGADQDLIDTLERQVVGDTRPHLTLVFDLAPEVGLERAQLRDGGAADRFERKGLSFHERLRDGFLAIARSDPKRCRVIDASRSADAVFADVIAAVRGRFHV